MLPVPGVVDVVALVRREPVIGGVVDALEGQGRPQLVAFGRVVVDHVEDHLDPGIVEMAHHLLDLVDEGRREVARLRREEADGVVAPVVPQSLLDEIAVVDEGMDRQQLDGGDAETADVVDHLVLHEAGEGAAKLLRHGRMLHGEAAQMRLIDDRALPRGLRPALASPGEGRLDDAAFGHEARAVALVEGEVGIGRADRVAEERRIPVAGRRSAAWRRDRAGACSG